jgi:multiple sugar transport system substrate-binding protein
MALSSQSHLQSAAAELAREIASPGVQAGIYVRSGGQPGHGAAWESKLADSLVGGFFTATRETMNQAFLRPRVSGHRQFQPRAGELIHECIWADTKPAQECVSEFERLAESLLPEWRRQAA